jgi:hypothetical protein
LAGVVYLWDQCLVVLVADPAEEEVAVVLADSAAEASVEAVQVEVGN